MTAPYVPPAQDLESALAAARVENERLRALIAEVVDIFDLATNPERAIEAEGKENEARLENLVARLIQAALSPPAAPGPATGGTP